MYHLFESECKCDSFPHDKENYTRDDEHRQNHMYQNFSVCGAYLICFLLIPLMSHSCFCLFRSQWICILIWLQRKIPFTARQTWLHWFQLEMDCHSTRTTHVSDKSVNDTRKNCDFTRTRALIAASMPFSVPFLYKTKRCIYFYVPYVPKWKWFEIFMQFA